MVREPTECCTDVCLSISITAVFDFMLVEKDTILAGALEGGRLSVLPVCEKRYDTNFSYCWSNLMIAWHAGCFSYVYQWFSSKVPQDPFRGFVAWLPPPGETTPCTLCGAKLGSGCNKSGCSCLH